MSKDTIYREDAIKAIEELPNAYNGWSDAYDKAYIISTLEEVPKAEITADDVLEYCRPRLLAIVAEEALRSADRPQGEWRRHPIHDYRAWDVCTACGIGCRRRHYGFNEDGTEWVEEESYSYCPWCGAKMDGERGGE